MNRSLSWLGTGTPIKSGGVKLVLRADIIYNYKSFFSSIWHSKCDFPLVIPIRYVHLSCPCSIWANFIDQIIFFLLYSVSVWAYSCASSYFDLIMNYVLHAPIINPCITLQRIGSNEINQRYGKFISFAWTKLFVTNSEEIWIPKLFDMNSSYDKYFFKKVYLALN